MQSRVGINLHAPHLGFECEYESPRVRTRPSSTQGGGVCIVIMTVSEPKEAKFGF